MKTKPELIILGKILTFANLFYRIILGNQGGTVNAPRHRYQVMAHIVEKAGLPPVDYVCQQLHQEEDRLCQNWPTGDYTL